MNRKLTANQIIAGARAYSHNASRRAHQLSGPRRVRVMHGPVATADAATVALVRSSEGACEDCGLDSCAEQASLECIVAKYRFDDEQTKPSARALDNLGAEPARARSFRVGDRVRGNRIGLIGVVLTVDLIPGLIDVRWENGHESSVHPGGITHEPPAAPAEPSPAGGRDPLIGTRWLVNGDGCHLRRGSVITVCNVITVDHTHNCAKVMCTSGLEWFVPARGDKRIGLALEREREPAPSPVSEAPAVESDPIAECERLGITIRLGQLTECWIAESEAYPCGGLVSSLTGVKDRVACARAALEAWSRREPAQ